MLKKNWKKALLPVDANVQQVIQNLDKSALQIALAVSTDGVLLGTLTDGDIRRGLLQGLHMDSPVDAIIQRDPLVVPPELNRDMVIQMMQANGLHHLPVVDSDRHVVGLHLLEELLLPNERLNVMVIMAGGQGTRLLPYTKNCPKPLLPVGGKPMLEHIVERARREGFRHFLIATHYLGHMIEDYFGDGGRWQIKIDYLREEIPLGTAGALALMESRPEASLLVSNGDVLTDIHYGDFLDFHCRHNAVATMAVQPHEWQHPFGVIRTKGVDITAIEEKPVIRSHINAGIYALGPEVFDALKAGEYCDMTTLFDRLRTQGARTIVYPMHEPWLDVGQAADFKRAQNKGAGETS